jgi:NAD(P)H dehydrogenase (quinone)
MKTLVIFSNPNEQGHCAAILREVETRLMEKNVDFQVLKLEKNGYDPVMRPQEHFTAGAEEINPLTKKYLELMTNADRLIFIYPVWWSTMPAMLKGFFDKTLQPRIAYQYVKYPWLWFAIPKGLWTQKKAMVICTSGAKKWMSLVGQSNRFKSVIKNDILGFCGIKAKVYQLGGCLKYSEERLPEIKSIVKKGMSWLYR